MTRHRLFASVLLVVALLAAPSLSRAQTRERVYFGTYTRTTSRGIYQATFNLKTRTLGPVTLAAATDNPSYLVISPNGRFVYAVNELTNYEGKPTGAISAFAVDPASGKLRLLNQVASGGTLPCYLSFDNTGRYLMVANYGTGNFAIFALQPDGGIGKRTAFVQHHGHGINPRRQAGPHAHFAHVSPHNHYVLSVDLGLDQVLFLHFNPANGTVSPATPAFVRVTPGTGPRHFVFANHGKQLYLVSELGSELFAFNYQPGRLTLFQSLNTRPTGYSGENAGAEVAISPDNRFLYASNRGSNMIAEYAISPTTHKVSLVEDVSTQGSGPRMFQIDPTGNYLWVGNQISGNIVVFRRQAGNGKLVPIGLNVALAMPVCIQFQMLR